MISPGHSNNIALVYWTYSREEWSSFLHWKKMRKGFLYYLWYRITSKRKKHIPGVTITPEKVCIDDKYEFFRGESSRVKHIHLHDAGGINILEISYEMISGTQTKQRDIRVLVPRGKLKEAIALQEKIMDEIMPPVSFSDHQPPAHAKENKKKKPQGQ